MASVHVQKGEEILASAERWRRIPDGNTVQSDPRTSGLALTRRAPGAHRLRRWEGEWTQASTATLSAILQHYAAHKTHLFPFMRTLLLDPATQPIVGYDGAPDWQPISNTHFRITVRLRSAHPARGS